MLFDRLDEWAPVAAQAVLQSLLQGMALTVLAWGMLRVFRRLRAAARYGVWGFTLALVIGLTGWNWFHLAGSYVHTAWQLDSRWYVALACGWGVMAATRLGGLLRSYGATRRLVRGASAAGSKCATSSELAVPVVAGIVRPVILIPESLMAHLSGPELDQVVMHEKAHIRRGDHWINPALELLRAIFFFHPAVWWIVRELRAERELACDDAVIRMTGEPVAFADCLAKLLEFSACAPNAPADSGDAFRRVERLVGKQWPSGQRAAHAALAACLAALVLSAVWCSRAPALVQFRVAPDARAQQAAAALAGALEKEQQAEEQLRAANEQWHAATLARQEAQEHLEAADRRLRTANEKLRLAELRNGYGPAGPLKKS